MHFSYREWNGVSETGVNAEARAGQKLCSGFSEKKVNESTLIKRLLPKMRSREVVRGESLLFEQMASNGKCFTDRINVDWFMKFNFV